MKRLLALFVLALLPACGVATSGSHPPAPVPPPTPAASITSPSDPRWPLTGPAPAAFNMAITVRGPDGNAPMAMTGTFQSDQAGWAGPYPCTAITTGVSTRMACALPAGIPLANGGALHVEAPGLQSFEGRANSSPEGCPCDPGQVDEVHLLSLLPPPPTRQQLLTMQTAMYGLRCNVPEFGGDTPWWDPGIQFIPTLAGRQNVYACKHGRGDTGIITGPGLYAQILYDESGNPYQVPIPTFDLAARVIEQAQNGFLTDLYLDGDAMGWQVAMDEIPVVHALLLQGGPPQGPNDLNQYVNIRPAWDGWFYGPVTIDQIMQWGAAERAVCPYCVVTFEFNTGHIPFGEGGNDYLPGGRMQDFDGLKIEFSNTVHDDNNWQIVARLIGPAYVHPADDPNGSAPWYLVNPTPRGPWGVECFEPNTYGWVRNDVTQATADSDRQYLKVEGCPTVD